MKTSESATAKTEINSQTIGAEIKVKSAELPTEADAENKADKGNEPTYFFGELSLSVDRAGRDKSQVSICRKSNVLHVDVFNIGDFEKREKFIKTSGLTEAEAEALKAELLKHAANSRIEYENFQFNEQKILSARLSDGRIIEALTGGMLAIYKPDSDSVEYAPSMIDGDNIYKPFNDVITANGMLADTIGDYENEIELIAEIETYILRHYDLSEREGKLTAYYVLLTYLTDLFYEVPYLHPTGKSGSGKTRFGETVISICYRPLIFYTVTEASLFRLIDRYQPTIFIDEFNLQDSSDSTGIMQVLNGGWSRNGNIPRCNEKGEVELFSPFGCKIIASLKKMQSDALESRCIDIETKETTRTDIQYTNIGQIADDALPLRQKLMRYRLKNLNRNIKDDILTAENELKKYSVRARIVQKATPLFAVIRDENLKRDFIKILVDETRIAKQLAEETFEFEIVSAIHEILFEPLEESDNEYRLRKSYFPDLSYSSQIFEVQTENGKICDALTVENITAILNKTRTKEKDKIEPRNFGRTLVKTLRLETDKCRKRKSDAYDKRAVKFDRERLNLLFANYRLPLIP